MRRSLCALLISICLITPSLMQAQDIPGREAPAFTQASAAWLSGEDDLAALQSLSALANEGNAAA